MTPTIWDAASAGPSAAISGGGLVYTTSNYYSNNARTVAGVDAGKWYWELTLTAWGSANNMRVGVDADSSSDSGLFYTSGVSALSQGDVLGFAFDVSAGTLNVTRNGAAWKSLTSVVRTPQFSPAWGPAIGSADTLGAPLVITANFGASAFAYTVPSGFEAGFGSLEIVFSAAGLHSGTFGAASIDYPPVVAGMRSGGLGTPAMAQTVDVAGIRAGSALGRVTLKFDQTVGVAGFRSGRFGPVSAPGGLLPSTQTPAVPSLRVRGLGAVVVVATTSAAVTPMRRGGLGAVVATTQQPVTPMRAGRLGVVALTLTLPVQPLRGGRFGLPAATFRLPVAGLRRGAFGVPRGFAQSTHEASGFHRGALGSVTGRWTYRVRPVAGRGRFGRPVLGATPC